MSKWRTLIGGVLTLAAVGFLGGCASANDGGQTAANPPASSMPSSASTIPAGTVSQSPDRTAVPPTPISPAPVSSSAAGSTQILIPSAPATSAGSRLTLVGTVEDGVEASCLILTDESTGHRYNVTDGDPAIVKVGARVKVTGVIRTDLMSHCQQGPIFQVLTATKA